MKIKTDFTPGPWKYEQSLIGLLTCDFVVMNDDMYGLHIQQGEKGYGHVTKESGANARLIAAAPEMFQALVDLYFQSDLGRERIKNIIEKVTGKTIKELESEK